MTTKTWLSAACATVPEVRRWSLVRHAAALVIGIVLAGLASGGRAMQAEIDALMRDYTGNVPGASVLVLRDGEPIVSGSYGLADLEKTVAAAPSTNYPPRVGHQAVHRRLDSAAGRGRRAALDDRCASGCPRCRRSRSR